MANPLKKSPKKQDTKDIDVRETTTNNPPDDQVQTLVTKKSSRKKSQSTDKVVIHDDQGGGDTSQTTDDIETQAPSDTVSEINLQGYADTKLNPDIQAYPSNKSDTFESTTQPGSDPQSSQSTDQISINTSSDHIASMTNTPQGNTIANPQQSSPIQDSQTTRSATVQSQDTAQAQISYMDPAQTIKPDQQSETEHKPVNIDSLLPDDLNTATGSTASDLASINSPKQQSTDQEQTVQVATPSNDQALNQTLGQITQTKQHSLISLLLAGIGFITLIVGGLLVYKMMFGGVEDQTNTQDTDPGYIDAQFVSGDIPILQTGAEPDDLTDIGGQETTRDENSTQDTPDTTDIQAIDGILGQIQESIASLGSNSGQETDYDETTSTEPQVRNYMQEFEGLLTQLESGYQYSDLQGFDKAHRLYKIIKIQVQKTLSQLKDGEVLDQTILEQNLTKYKAYLQRAEKMLDQKK